MEVESWVKGSRIRKPVPTNVHHQWTTNDCRRTAFRRDTMDSEQSVVRWCKLCKFSVGSGVFNPSFSKTEQIQMMWDNEIRQGGWIACVKDRTDIKGTYKLNLAGPGFSSISPERKRQARRRGLHQRKGRRWVAMRRNVGEKR